MLFGKKKLSKQELEAQVFQTKLALRRVMDRYQVMLERELRLAKAEKGRGVVNPSNYNKIRTMAGLLAVCKRAMQNLSDISTADELARVTQDLSAALGNLNRLAGSVRTDNRGLKRGIDRMKSNEEKMSGSFEKQAQLFGAQQEDADLSSLWEEIVYGTAPGKTPAAGNVSESVSDAELNKEIEAFNQNLDSILQDI